MRNLASREQELLRLASRLDVEALAEIYDRYSPVLYSYAMRLLNDPALAEDCVAETFARFLKSLQKGQGPRDYLRAYLYRITHNWIIDLYRNNEQTSELHETLQDEGFTEEEVTKRLRKKQLREAIRHLTQDQQKVISLKYLEDWSNEEIAEVLQKPVGAVKAIQHRALVSLQKLLTDQTDEKPDQI